MTCHSFERQTLVFLLSLWLRVCLSKEECPPSSPFDIPLLRRLQLEFSLSSISSKSLSNSLSKSHDNPLCNQVSKSQISTREESQIFFKRQSKVSSFFFALSYPPSFSLCLYFHQFLIFRDEEENPREKWRGCWKIDQIPRKDDDDVGDDLTTILLLMMLMIMMFSPFPWLVWDTQVYFSDRLSQERAKRKRALEGDLTFFLIEAISVAIKQHKHLRGLRGNGRLHDSLSLKERLHESIDTQRWKPSCKNKRDVYHLPSSSKVLAYNAVTPKQHRK